MLAGVAAVIAGSYMDAVGMRQWRLLSIASGITIVTRRDFTRAVLMLSFRLVGGIIRESQLRPVMLARSHPGVGHDVSNSLRITAI